MFARLLFSSVLLCGLVSEFSYAIAADLPAPAKRRVDFAADIQPILTNSCYECHAVHGAGGRPLVVKKAVDINAQCAACHTSVWAAFQKPYKHRLPEGARDLYAVAGR